VLSPSRSLLGRVAIPALLVSAVALCATCIAVAPEGIHYQTNGGSGGAGGSLVINEDSGPPANPPPDAGSDPHAVIGADPAHGPFNGGQRVLVSGRGFTSDARIWFGATEVDETTTVAVSPTQVQVVAPAGTPGPVDLSVQDGSDTSTKRTLPAGYVYDALYAVPDTGPVAGGTVISILGQGTAWDATTVARIDQNPCTTLQVVSPTQLTCTVPAGSPGSKTISVVTGSDDILVLDAYVYADSTNGFKGGLSGSALAGQLTVLVYDNISGDPIPDALVIVGSDIATALEGSSDANGVAVIQDASLVAPQTVTVAAQCHSPISFVAEPVDTVTTYLDPVLSPSCGSGGDPPPVGGQVGDYGGVQGELVWPTTLEFMKGGWSNVPSPIGAKQRKAAYVFEASSYPTATWQLPDPSTAVTTATPGSLGYQFTIDMYPGNISLYAVAGIEDDSKSPPEFTGYAMGAVVGVPVLPNQYTSGVYIQMSKTLDQALTMNLTPPAPGPSGPDRLDVTVSVSLGASGYVILPGMQKSPFLPVQGTLPFVGVPSLTGSLAGSLYVSTASAVTGAAATAPMSVIGRMVTNTTSQVIQVDGFVNVPVLTTPAMGAAWDGMSLATTFASGGAPVDLTVYDIASGNGLVHWTVAVPGGSQAVTLPSLASFPLGALPPGPLQIAVYGANITNFDYTQLTYAQMSPQGMTAYSLDNFDAHL
jgi:IPT/TIG domain